MDIDVRNRLNMYLEWYNKRIGALSTTDKSDLMKERNITIRSSYIFMREISFMIAYLKGDNADISKQEDLYHTLTVKLMDFEKDNREMICDNLSRTLRRRANCYDREVTTFAAFLTEYEGQLVIDIRTEMQTLIEVFKDRFNCNIEDIEEKFKKGDEELYNVFKYDIKEIVSGHNIFEISYFPDNFWWRHPSRLVDE